MVQGLSRRRFGLDFHNLQGLLNYRARLEILSFYRISSTCRSSCSTWNSVLSYGWSSLSVWIRSDSLQLVRAIRSKIYPMDIFGVLMDVECLSLYFNFVSFCFIHRDQNFFADFIAKSALYSVVNWFFYLMNLMVLKKKTEFKYIYVQLKLKSI